MRLAQPLEVALLLNLIYQSWDLYRKKTPYRSETDPPDVRAIIIKSSFSQTGVVAVKSKTGSYNCVSGKFILCRSQIPAGL